MYYLCVFTHKSSDFWKQNSPKKKKKNPDSAFLQYDLYIISEKIYV